MTSFSFSLHAYAVSAFLGSWFPRCSRTSDPMTASPSPPPLLEVNVGLFPVLLPLPSCHYSFFFLYPEALHSTEVRVFSLKEELILYLFFRISVRPPPEEAVPVTVKGTFEDPLLFKGCPFLSFPEWKKESFSYKRVSRQAPLQEARKFFRK